MEDLSMDGAPVLLGTSAEICVVRALVGLSAVHSEPVLIVGQVGTGKTLTSQVIHALSTRRSGPFERLQCDALTEIQLECELFGRNSCHHSTEGAIERAAGGPLFVDEVGALSSRLQEKLLHCLRTRKFSRTGELEERAFDVRLIASTRRSLREKVETGEFREDLRQLISTQLIPLPTLNERRNDLDALVGHFLEALGPHAGHPRLSITRGALALIATRKFPGNLHHLSHYLESLLVRAPPGDLLIDEAVVAKHEVRHRAAKAMKRARGDREHAAAVFGSTVPRFEYWLRAE